MEIIAVTKGNTIKRVLLSGAAPYSTREIERVALLAARESRSSLFGIRVGTPDVMGNVMVALHTD